MRNFVSLVFLLGAIAFLVITVIAKDLDYTTWVPALFASLSCVGLSYATRRD